jgi:hypothetical protein
MIDLAATLEELEARLKTIAGLRVYGYLADSVAPPAAVVAVDEIFYDATMGRGADTARFLVHVLVGRSSDRAATAALSPYAAGDGPQSIKAALEVAADGPEISVRVESATVATITVGAIDYLAATFTADVIA